MFSIEVRLKSIVRRFKLGLPQTNFRLVCHLFVSFSKRQGHRPHRNLEGFDRRSQLRVLSGHTCPARSGVRTRQAPRRFCRWPTGGSRTRELDGGERLASLTREERGYPPEDVRSGSRAAGLAGLGRTLRRTLRRTLGHPLRHVRRRGQMLRPRRRRNALSSPSAWRETSPSPRRTRSGFLRWRNRGLRSL